MSFPVTLNGTTYTLADFSGTSYVDGFPAALEDFVTHAGAIYSTTSTTSNVIGTGSKTFTVEASKPYQVGTPLRIADTAAVTTNWIDAIVTSYSGTSLVVTAVAYAGSGTKTAWSINIGGGPIAYTGTLPVAQGGTGATSATAAASNLGVGTEDSPTFSGLAVNGASTITTGDNTAQLTLISNDADANDGPLLVLNRNSSSPADNDKVGQIQFLGEDDASNSTIFGSIVNQIKDASNLSQDGRMSFNIISAGSDRTFFNLTHDGTQAEVVVNEDSQDIDFRVESNGNANMLFVDGGNDAVVIGHNNANDGSVSSAFALQNIGTSYNSSSIGLARFSADVNAPTVAFHKSRNASIGGDTVVADNDELGRIRFFGNDGTDFAEGARITALVNGTPGGGDMPTELVFATSADGAESPTARMAITSAGKIGIGTNSPASLIHGMAGDLFLTANSTSSDSGQGIYFQSTTSGWATSAAHAAIFGKRVDASNGYLKFDTRGSGTTAERMRLTNAGGLLVGTTSDPTASGVGIALQPDASGAFLARRTSTTNNNSAALFYNPNGLVGSIRTSGSATSFNTSSDYRLKTDAQPMTGASDRVLALKPVNFEWIADGTRVDGFLAHEAQAVVPEAVTGTKDAMMDEEYQVSAATGDIYTPATEAYVDADGNDVDAVEEVINSADVEQPETLADGQQWRETTAAVMGTRSVPDMQGIDQSKLVPLLVASLQEALARITALENA